MSTIPRKLLEEAKAWARARPHMVTGVYIGFRHRGGRRLKEQCLVFSVTKKQKDRSLIPLEDMVPERFGDVRTDVTEANYEVFSTQDYVRPVPGGYSVGHYRITAGTLGAPVYGTKDGDPSTHMALSNNHVLANSNDATQGDLVTSPGSHDFVTGVDEDTYRLGGLKRFVKINFGGGRSPFSELKVIAAAVRNDRPADPKSQGLLDTLRGIWEFLMGLFGGGGGEEPPPEEWEIPQPDPNLVDAALCEVFDDDDLLPTLHKIGDLNGVRDLQLGEEVRKIGRTTDLTTGTVTGVGGMVRVNYGPEGFAEFDDQVIIEGEGGDFSAGGDSGSVIVTSDNFLGGLLFAGGGGQTIANKISHVIAYLGIRV